VLIVSSVPEQSTTLTCVSPSVT